MGLKKRRKKCTLLITLMRVDLENYEKLNF